MFWKKKNRSKIGILYICTGKYHIFWKQFYETAEKFFCPNSDKFYFVYTDQSIPYSEANNVTLIQQSKLGWPFDTLHRFHMFIRNEHLLNDMDYLFYFNANMLFHKKIKEKEILPEKEKSGLVGVLHPYWHEGPETAPFETDQRSTAFVRDRFVTQYYQGCLSGGRREEYLKMCRELAVCIDKDAEQDIIAIWHDESHLNRYFSEHKPKLLHSGYAYPLGLRDVPFKMKIIQVNKNQFGGLEYLRS